ELNRKMIYM
nr:Chain C, Major immediate-early protein [Human betaherpesvirus 5]8ESH_C Chain C, CMV peptide [Human betaherpesvirus 5]